MPGRLDLRVRAVLASASIAGQVSGPGSGPAHAGEPGAEPDARLLGDQHDVGRAAAERRRAAAGQRGRADTPSVVAGPGHPGDRPAGRQRPGAPQRHVRRSAARVGRDAARRRSMISGRCDRRRAAAAPDRTSSHTPVGVHQVRRPHRATTPRAAHRDAHETTVRPVPEPPTSSNSSSMSRSAGQAGRRSGVRADPGVHGDPAGHPGVDRPGRAVLGDREDLVARARGRPRTGPGPPGRTAARSAAAGHASPAAATPGRLSMPTTASPAPCAQATNASIGSWWRTCW